MKTIIFLFILIQSISYSQMEIETHYNSICNRLNFFKYDENNFIAYGENGVIMRTNDGENWSQNYSGTHSSILKLIKSENKIFGITNNFELMVSNDFGDYWKYIKTDYQFNDIVKVGSEIILSTLTNKYYKTNDFGLTFIEKIAPVDSIFKIESVGDYLFLIDRQYRIKLSNDNGNNWQDFKLNGIEGNFKIKKINEKLYFYNSLYIVEVSNSLTQEIDNLSKFIDFEFCEYENGYLIFESSRSKRTITKYFYDKDKDSLLDIGINFESKYKAENYLINDVIYFKDRIFTSFFSKTILSSEPMSIEFKEHCYVPFTGALFKFLNEKSAIYIQDIPVRTIQSNDGGKIFKSNSQTIIDTTNDITDINYYVNDLYQSGDTCIIFLNFLNYFSPLSLAYLSTNKGKTFDSIPNFTKKYVKIIDVNKNNVIFHSESNNNSELKIFNLNLESNKVEDLITIDTVQGYAFTHKISENEFLVFITKDLVFNDNSKIQMLRTNDRFKTIKLIKELNNFHNMKLSYLHKYNNNLLFIQDQENHFYKTINNFTDLEIEKDTTLNSILQHRISFKNDNYIENKISTFYDVKFLDGFLNYEVISNYVKIKYEDDRFNVDTLGKSLGTNGLFYSEDKKIMYYHSNFQNVWIPIEPERLKYYTSVIEKPTVSSIWTYAPYPNPVKDKVKIKFNTWEMNNISKLSIDLVEIESGRIYPITKFNLNILDNYWGEIEINLREYSIGAYLINFKLGNSNKSESIIIE